MTNQLVAQEDASVEMCRADMGSSRRQRWFELVLLLSIAIGPSIIGSLQMLSTDAQDLRNSHWSLLLFHEITSLLLLVYILSRRRMRLNALGLHWSLRDIARGVGLTFGSYCAYTLGYVVVHAIHSAAFGAGSQRTSPQSMFGHFGAFAISLSIVNPFFEELIVRAYLMTEVKDLTGSSVFAILLSVVVQTTYHLYYGWQGALTLAFLFASFALYYAWSRRATPIVIAHGVFDFMALVRLW